MTGSQALLATRPLLLKVLLVALLAAIVFSGQAFLRAAFVDAGAGAKFTVNNVGNGLNETAGNGICEVTLGQGDCTLAAAIEESNDDADHNTINFDNGVFAVLSPGTIKLDADLPPIEEDLTIDAVNRGVIIDGGNYGSGNGLEVDASLGTVNEFIINGGSSTLEITDFGGDGIHIDGNGGDLIQITIDGVDINSVAGDGIEITNFANAGSSTITISNNEIDATSGADGVNITQDGSDLNSNTVNVTGNTIQAAGEAVDIEFNGPLSDGDVLTINVDDNVELVSTGDDAVDIEYCDGGTACEVINASINISVSGNGSLDGNDEAVDVGVNAATDDCLVNTAGGTACLSDSVDVTINIDNNGPITATNSDGVRVDVDICCETSDNNVTVTVDGGGNITGSSDDGVDVNIDTCCGNNNDATVSVSNNNNITGSGSRGVEVDVSTRDTEGNTSDNSDIQVDINGNNNILGGGSDGVRVRADAGSETSEADANTIVVNVNDNRNITGSAGDGVEIVNGVGTTADSVDADANSAEANVMGNREIDGSSGGVRIIQAAYGDTAGSAGNSTSATVSGNSDIYGNGSDGVLIGANVCCDAGNTNDINVVDNLGSIASTADDAIDIQGTSDDFGFDPNFLCCSQNTINIEDNVGVIEGADNGIEISACGDVVGEFVDLGCVDDSTTILVIDGNDISNSGGNGIRICCGDFGDPAGSKGIDRSVIRDNIIDGNGGAGIRIENASGIQTGPTNVITSNGFAGIAIVEHDFLDSVAGPSPTSGLPEADGNTITQNSILDNVKFGIDLDGDQAVGCSVGGDSDPNNCLNEPTLLVPDGNTLLGTSCGDCQIEIFVADNIPNDHSDHGEGAIYLTTVQANELGFWSVELCEVAGPTLLTATQTNAGGDTSEFGKNIAFGGTDKDCDFTPTPDPTEETATPDPDSASIEVCKDTNPESSGKSFDFDTDIPGMGDPDLEDDECDIEEDVDPDTYEITENPASGWVLDDIDCDGTSSSNIDTDLDNETVTIDLQEGDHVVCTFTNIDEDEATSSITVCKETDPEGASKTFDFETDLPDLGDFELEDGECDDEVDIDADEYTITELEQDGWNLTEIDCTGTDEDNIDIDLDDLNVVVDLQGGEDVECTFTNTEKPDVTVTPTPSPTSPVSETDTPVPPTATSTNTPVIPATPGNTIGDVNKNGVINAIDAQLILQAEAGFITLANPKNADVNVDGEVNSVDATLIQQFVAALIGSLPPVV